jgi:hypothetical protein
MSKERLQAMKQEREKLVQEIRKLRPQQQKLMDEAREAQALLLASAQRQAERSGDRRPRLKVTIEDQKDQQAILELNLYDAAGWHEDLDRAVKELKLDSQATAEVAKLMAAKVWEARAKKFEERLWYQQVAPGTMQPKAPPPQSRWRVVRLWSNFWSWMGRYRTMDTGFEAAPLNDEQVREARMEACLALREVLRLNPKNDEARQLLRELELDFVKGIAAKLEHENELARAAFHRYLKARGYYIEKPEGLWSAWEALRVSFLTGPVSYIAEIFGGLAGRAADKTIEVQDQVAKHQVALLGIRTLINNGMTLQEVWERTSTPEELAKYMTFFTVGRGRLEPDKIQKLSKDIFDTFIELRDLVALARGDKQDYLKLHSRNYYRVVDPDKSIVEMVGDEFLSPKGLLMWFLPGAIIKSGTTWVYDTPALTLEARGWKEGLVLFTGTEEMWTAKQALGTPLEWLMKRYEGNTALKFAQEAILADQKYLQTLGEWRALGNRFIAAQVLNQGLGQLGETYHVPGLSLLIDALAILGPCDVTYDILARAGKERQLRQALEEMEKAINRGNIKLLAEAKAVAQLEAIAAKQASVPAAAGAPPKLPSAEEVKQIEQIETELAQSVRGVDPYATTLPAVDPNASTLPAVDPFASTLPAPRKQTLIPVDPNASTLPARGTGTLVPGANPCVDHAEALGAACDSLKKGGALKEAKAALEFSKAQQSLRKAILEKKMKSVNIAGRILDKHPEVLQVNPQTVFATIEMQLHPETDILGQVTMGGKFGVCLYYGDLHVQSNEWGKAKTLYRAALASAGEDGWKWKLIQERLALLETAERDREKFRALRFLTDTQVYSIQGKTAGELEKSKEKFTQYLNAHPKNFEVLQSGGSPVFKVRLADDAGKEAHYVFKPDAAVAGEEKAMAEQLGALLFTEGLQGKAPRPLYLKGVNCPQKPGAEGILLPYVENSVPLAKLTEPEILALKGDLAKIRVFRLWIADTDGHWGNILVRNGEPVLIDCALANLRKELQFQQLGGVNWQEFGIKPPNNQKEFMEAALSFTKILETRIPKEDLRLIKYKWMERIDGMLSYDDLYPTVKMIRELAADDQKLNRIFDQASPALLTPEFRQEMIGVLKERAKDLDEVLKKKFKTYKDVSVLPFPGPRYARVQSAPDWGESLALAA